MTQVTKAEYEQAASHQQPCICALCSAIASGEHHEDLCVVDDLPLPVQVSDLTAPLTQNTPSGPVHLYVVVLFAYHKTELRADSLVIPSVAYDDQGSLKGASELNLKSHPIAEWSGHQEFATIIPDHLIRQVVPFMAPEPVQQAFGLGAPETMPDPFASLPVFMPPPPSSALPDVNPAQVPSFPSPTPVTPPQALPKYLVVAMHSDRTYFNLPR